MEVSTSERRTLDYVRAELAEVLRSLDMPRQEALSAAGISTSAFDTAWSRGSMRLLWILRILATHGVDPKDFFDRALALEGLRRPDTEPPEISKIGRRRLEAGK